MQADARATLAALATQPVAVPTGPTKRPCEWCADTGMMWCRNLADELVQRPCNCGAAPASRDSTLVSRGAVPTKDSVGVADASASAGRRAGCEQALQRQDATKDAAASEAQNESETLSPDHNLGRDSTRGTACAEWCGTANWPEGGTVWFPDEDSNEGFCTHDCSYKRRPLHTTPPSTRGTCERCRGSRVVLNERKDVRHWNNPSSHFQPCPDCATPHQTTEKP